MRWRQRDCGGTLPKRAEWPHGNRRPSCRCGRRHCHDLPVPHFPFGLVQVVHFSILRVAKNPGRMVLFIQSCRRAPTRPQDEHGKYAARTEMPEHFDRASQLCPASGCFRNFVRQACVRPASDRGKETGMAQTGPASTTKATPSCRGASPSRLAHRRPRLRHSRPPPSVTRDSKGYGVSWCEMLCEKLNIDFK